LIYDDPAISHESRSNEIETFRSAAMSEELAGQYHCGGIHFQVPAREAGVLAYHREDGRKLEGYFNIFCAFSLVNT
jgi:hypothetical protein